MEGYITLHDAEVEFGGEYATLLISNDAVIWAGEDYDGNTVVCYNDGDGVHIVRSGQQGLEEVMNG